MASVAVCRDDAVLHETVTHCGRTHTRRLLGMTQDTLAGAGVSLNEVDAFAISRGPGSFTGVRVGVAAWKGLALAVDRPLVGVDTLDALARGSGAVDGVLCAMLDARMKEVFSAIYRFQGGRRERIAGPMVAPVESVLAELPPGRAAFAGDGAEAYRDRIAAACPEALFCPPCVSFPRAGAVAAEARAALEGGQDASAEPVYLRKSQAELAREGPVE
jgi:tRNA threonylcarbamoyladenosine biosynthesis protein TsaB